MLAPGSLGMKQTSAEFASHLGEASRGISEVILLPGPLENKLSTL
jgi:hypothetical protein